jgi:ATP-dependent Clp protease protease subunit
VAKANNDEKELHYMHAWVEAGGDPTLKQSYKFPHHKAGTDTAAVIAGVNNALARLSQANIPAADDAGVKAHLDAHRKDAGLDVSAEAAVPVRQPIRCFQGETRPHEAFWRWNLANVEEGLTPAEPEMELYGYISEYSWFEDDITPKMFKDDLYNFGKGGPITLRINSGGGDMIAASVMRSMLMDYPGTVTVKIDGLAASAATMVAIAGDVIKMQESAYFMIHDPMAAFFMASLNIEELSRLLDQMKTAKSGLVDAYQSKSGLNRDKIASMMTKETWMTANEAKTFGFVDEVITAKASKGNKIIQNAAIVNSLRNFMNIPEPLKAMLHPEMEMVDSEEGQETTPIPGTNHKAAERLRAKVKIFKEKKG